MLKRINERFYSYLDRETGMLFTLWYGDRGIYGFGKSWYLQLTYCKEKHGLATFTMVDDGHKCYKGDYKGQLWHNFDIILIESNRMIKDMIS